QEVLRRLRCYAGRSRVSDACGDAITPISATGAATYVPFYLTLLAEAEGNANELDQGLGHLAEAERLLVESEERWAAAELYRVRGELLWVDHDPTAAERCFRQAIGIAQRQSAKFWSCALRSVSPGSARARQARCGPQSPRPGLRRVH